MNLKKEIHHRDNLKRKVYYKSWNLLDKLFALHFLEKHKMSL